MFIKSTNSELYIMNTTLKRKKRAEMKVTNNSLVFCSLKERLKFSHWISSGFVALATSSSSPNR